MRPTASFAEKALPNGLATHQLDALSWLRNRPVALIADPTGAGKTAVAAATIAYAIDIEGARRSLWVTEAHLIPQTMRELRRFLPTLSVNRWPGSPTDDVRIVSVETLTRRLEAVEAWAAHVGVIDDASVKGNGPEPAAVARVLSGTRRRVALTATPVELDATEAYRILQLLGAPDLPDEGVFDALIEWQNLPFGESRPLRTLPEAVEQVRSVFARYVLRRDVDELGLVLPGLREETIWVRLTPPQQRAYGLAGGERSPLAQASRRESACSFAGGRSAKAERALAWLLARPHVGKVVIFAEHRRHLTLMEQLLDGAGIQWVRIDGTRSRTQRATAIQAFKADREVRVLLGTKVLERGIDGLQHCAILLSLGASYNPAREEQRVGRLRRPGSPHPLVHHVTFTSDTPHEKEKHQSLARRRAEAAALIHGLSAITATEEIHLDLSETQVQELFTARRWLAPPKCPYGTPLGEIGRLADDQEFLQHAVRAGHVPDLDSLELAINAYILHVNAEARREGYEVPPGSGFISEIYRKMAAALTAEADRLERLGPAQRGRPTG